MYSLIFSITWTVLAATGILLFARTPESESQSMIFQIVMIATPFAGFLFIWDSLRKLRRIRNVRRKQVAGKTMYIWTDPDGTERRSETDPRPAWDMEDRDFAD